MKSPEERVKDFIYQNNNIADSLVDMVRTAEQENMENNRTMSDDCLDMICRSLVRFSCLHPEWLVCIRAKAIEDSYLQCIKIIRDYDYKWPAGFCVGTASTAIDQATQALEMALGALHGAGKGAFLASGGGGQGVDASGTSEG